MRADGRFGVLGERWGKGGAAAAVPPGADGWERIERLGKRWREAGLGELKSREMSR